MKNKFDTNVQKLKYEVLKAVADLYYEDRLEEDLLSIAEKIVPGPKATMRCCIYKERAIVNERVKVAMGTGHKFDSVIEVLQIACDECPVTQITVGDACRGCIAHRCANVCPRGAISFPEHRAVIDHDKCILCGKCVEACPYSAITKNQRPCERACKVGAILMDDNKKARIDESKCISCGACVYQCPFGAITDRSFIVDCIRYLKRAKSDEQLKVYAVVAPSISGQFMDAKVGQVVSGLKELGFYSVVEAALGADMVAYKESLELAEKGFLTSSCCPAFVEYVKKAFPDMADHISGNLSPMAEIARYIKGNEPDCRIVFIGPCTAKKKEILDGSDAGKYIDCVITFEELQALFDSREVDLNAMEDDVLDNASYFGRIFARSGGISEAVKEAMKEHNIDMDVRCEVCDGITECKMALLKASKGKLEADFIEGMACDQGCIGGAACLTHGQKNKAEVDKYGREAMEKSISDAVNLIDFK